MPLVNGGPEEVEAILEESGYENIDVWLEPEKVFCIGKAKKQIEDNICQIK